MSACWRIVLRKILEHPDIHTANGTGPLTYSNMSAGRKFWNTPLFFGVSKLGLVGENGNKLVAPCGQIAQQAFVPLFPLFLPGAQQGGSDDADLRFSL